MLAALAVTVGVAAVGSVATALSVLDRELDAAYRSSNPASVVLTIPNATDQAIGIVESLPEVEAVERRREVLGQIEDAAGDRLPIVLVAVEGPPSIGRFLRAPDTPMPGPGEMVVERSSLRETPIAVGEHRRVRVGGAGEAELTVSGIVHDPGRTPAWLTGAVVGFVTPDTLGLLGLDPTLDRLLVLADPGNDRAANQRLASTLRTGLERAGIEVTRVEVPVPGEHPSARVLRTLLYILQGFGVVALLTAGALVAIVISALLRREARSIGLMKAIGGGAGQIAGMYLGGVAALGLVGTAIGIPFGLAGGRAYAAFAGSLLNIDITDPWPDGGVLVAQVLVGLVVPVLAATPPVVRAARTTVRGALDLQATGRLSTPTIRRIRRRLLTLGAGNVRRVPVRTALTVGALALGGAAFMVALSTGAAWQKAVDAEFSEVRNYDLEIALTAAAPLEQLTETMQAIETVEGFELWTRQEAQARTAAGVGEAFPLYVIPAGTQMVTLPLLDGRLPAPGEDATLVTTQLVDDPKPSPGDELSLDVAGEVTTWTVAGVVKRLAGGPTGAAFTTPTRPPTTANHIVVASTGDPDRAARDAQEALHDRGIAVASVTTAADAREALDDHLYIIVGLLLVVAGLVAVVGGLGLMETLATGVTERRREIGVMRALGAGTSTLLRILSSEALAIAVMGWGVALILAVPGTAVVASTTGTLFTGAPLEPAFSPWGVGLWLGLSVIGALVAAGLPTLEISESPASRVLAYE